MSLEITPADVLLFKGPFTAVSTTSLELFNNGNDRLAFKIKTTAPKRYCVKPNAKYLEPQERCTAQIMLQPLPVNNTNQQDDITITKHKLMVQYAVVPKTYVNDIESFWKQDKSILANIKDSKLICRVADASPIINRQKLKATTELGYLKSERVVGDSPGTEVICSICHNVLWKPIACRTCENIFCSQCIRTWTNNMNIRQSDQFVTAMNDEKPNDNAKTCPFHCMFEEKQAPPIVNTLLSKLELYCAYRPNGCQQKLNYNALEVHEQMCEFEHVPCPVCQMFVSQRDRTNNQHDIRTCFAQIKATQVNNQVQTQLMMLLNIIEQQDKRIKVLEERLNMIPQ